MIHFNIKTAPFGPENLEPTEDFKTLLREGTVTTSTGTVSVEDFGRHFGITLSYNVVPPTPLRAVEVAFPVSQDETYPLEHQISFMTGILAGAMVAAARLRAAGPA